ncbi:response regulator [Marinobacterium mangrovicola]|uniref:Response regulator receiver domain-containing protein n=1 Tax=Marinobacterium mangrovicola TaxID=1476959 RepID=A0A4R1GMP4_9GAMM|nr:response regulator [Marinobacterium mangrovicola]TCK08433.1 response regulator receiver domain-containing protein [Marinobacterium mangrovicola]
MSAPIPVVICDDSPLARKQMGRSLAEWNLSVTEASHGLEAIEAARAGKAHLLFLDLNMPIMDGYQTLERIRAQDLPCIVIVVSGDIQPQARKRVLDLGAIGFIRKPIDKDAVREALASYGILDELEPSHKELSALPTSGFDQSLQLQDYYQELSNIALGSAAERLAQLLGVFVQLPVPRVRLIEGEEISALLEQVRIESGSADTLCQGFLGAGIAGEAMLVFDQHSLEDMAKLMQLDGDMTPQLKRELLMDIANVLISAYLGALGDQIQVHFSQGPPVILGSHCDLPPSAELERWQQTLTIELGYRVEGYDISCNLLLLFTEDSLAALHERTKHL